jgi:hypothetical protein
MKVPKRRSGLHLSEKELQEQRSGTFRHQNTPGHNHTEKNKPRNHNCPGQAE